jgi:hypothetical protein
MPSSNESTMLQPRFLLLVGLVFAAALARLAPHPLNFTPIGAIALFAGAHFARKQWAFALPLAAMFVSDLVLYAGRYEAYRQNLVTTSLLVYGSIALIVCVGLWLRNRRRVRNIAAATLAGSLVFFVVTNFGAWLSYSMYPKTWAGLVDCYVLAIPFFRNTLLGDAFYVTVLFGAFALAERRLPALQERPALANAE